MYLIETVIDKEQMAKRFSPALAEQAARMEIHGSSFNDPGEDFCEFRLIDTAGVVFVSKRIPGY